jgi:predicted ABC-type ATPase
MKIYTIVGGVNGVGKSSFTGVLKSRTTDLGVIVDVDKITAQMGGKALEGGKRAIRIMEDCIRDGVSFTQETTLSGHRPKAAAKRAKEAGYYIRLYYVGLDTAEESKRRIANRVARGGHDIDEADVERRFAGRWEALRAVLPFCDEAAFYDNDNGFVEVAAYRNGELILEGERRPRWIAELAEYLKGEAPER